MLERAAGGHFLRKRPLLFPALIISQLPHLVYICRGTLSWRIVEEPASITFDDDGVNLILEQFNSGLSSGAVRKGKVKMMSQQIITPIHWRGVDRTTTA